MYAHFVGAQWQMQTPASKWLWVGAPDNPQGIAGLTVTVTPHYIEGGTDARGGVVCTDAASRQAAYAFFLDGQGSWEIDAVNGSGSLDVLASGPSRFSSGDVSGVCISSPDNVIHLGLEVGGILVGAAIAQGTVSTRWGGGVAMISRSGQLPARFSFSDFSLTDL